MPRPVLLSTGIQMPLVAEGLAKTYEVHWLNKAADPNQLLAEIAPKVSAICTGAHTGVKTDAAMIGQMPKLRIIGNLGVGYDSIDIATAARRGIVITNTPDVLNEEVADTAIGLLLSTVRELPQSEVYLRAGVPKAQIKTGPALDAGHGFVTESEGGSCERSAPPYVVHCGYDQAHDLLEHIYGPLHAKSREPMGKLVTFDQAAALGVSERATMA